MENNIAARVLTVIAQQLEMDASLVKPESTPEQLKIDSLRMVDIIFSLEEEFDVSIDFNANDPGAQGFKMDTVGDVITYMQKLASDSDVG